MSLSIYGARLLDITGLQKELGGPSRDLVREMTLEPNFPIRKIRSKEFYPEWLVAKWIEDTTKPRKY
ncbi:hypothetical protein [Leuconostoc gasicomitatum]|uniref:Uncharacterized protein n=1 Tax=Leuconostoc gasicomitatum TaxID=115778 RepID=A0A9Q3SXH3_9LACO|nr:hypothetical protein [Leuconostoc gasicomitatum]MBD9365109.1 hypothetical protein [Leuconostoc mesenteroides]MBZ5962659.1 hypothetical protein [Leuconostoc gasicomitatum]